MRLYGNISRPSSLPGYTPISHHAYTWFSHIARYPTRFTTHPRNVVRLHLGVGVIVSKAGLQLLQCRHRGGRAEAPTMARRCLTDEELGMRLVSVSRSF